MLSVIADICGVLGFIASIAAWQQAKGAKTAADAARAAIRRSNATEDMQALLAKADELLACIQDNQIEAARLSARKLVSEVIVARQRWRDFLSDESVVQLENTTKHANRVSRALSATQEEIVEAREKLLKSCHDVAEGLADEVGKMLRLIERG